MVCHRQNRWLEPLIPQAVDPPTVDPQSRSSKPPRTFIHLTSWHFYNPHLGIFVGKTRKTGFSPRGSVWNVEGGVLLSVLLGLAACTFWSDLEKFPKSASGKILAQHFGSGTFLGRKMVPEKVVLWRSDFVEGF